MVLNLKDSFLNPIDSSDVNTFECEKETLAKSVLKNVTEDEDIVKVAAIKLSNKTVHIALLH